MTWADPSIHALRSETFPVHRPTPLWDSVLRYCDKATESLAGSLAFGACGCEMFPSFGIDAGTR